jgi:hypothetical protein
MKKDKIIYWTSTGLLALAMVASGIMYLTSPQMVAAFGHLGFPGYFRIELGIAKILGSIAIILPMTPNKIKEWAYAGLSISFISAPIASYCVGDPIGVVVTPLFFLGLLAVSYIYKDKMNA